MAVIQGTLTNAVQGMATMTWVLGDEDTGSPFVYSNHADKTVQAFGTLDQAVTIQGSNDPRALSDPDNAVWATLSDNFGTPIVFSAAGIRLIAEAPLYIRPSAAASLTDATIIILANES